MIIYCLRILEAVPFKAFPMAGYIPVQDLYLYVTVLRVCRVGGGGIVFAL